MNLLRVRMEPEGEQLYLQGQGFRVRVPQPLADRLPGYDGLPFGTGGEILLGLRPEAICDPHYMANPDPQTLVTGRVTAREYTGPAIYLHLALSGQEIVARMDERTNAWPPDNFTVAFDMEQMHAFDPRTETALL